MNAPIVRLNHTDCLKETVDFLSQPSSYRKVKKVKALETHMSWVFLTDRYVYKLKKPVCFTFLGFRTVSARHSFCMEEIRVNQPLAGNTYVGVIPLKSFRGLLRLNGKGEAIDWLVKMIRLPEQYMLHTALAEGTLRNDWVQRAAEKVVDFYMVSTPVGLDVEHFCRQMVKDIEFYSVGLLDSRFQLQHTLISGITTDLRQFLSQQGERFDRRIAEGRIIDAHGDLRPEHICLGRNP